MPMTEEAVEESVSKFSSKHGFPQCIDAAIDQAIYGTHVTIKQPSGNETDYIIRKRRYTVNIQAVADYKYCFTDVMIK